MPFTVHLTGIAKGVTQKRFLRPSTVGPITVLALGPGPSLDGPGVHALSAISLAIYANAHAPSYTNQDAE